MPEKNTTTQEQKAMTPEELAKSSNPLEKAKDFLESDTGKNLLKEIKEIEKDLKGRGLKLEDYLIVGAKTLKEATKKWDKKKLDKGDNLARYAALYIAACNKKEVPVTFICPKHGLKKKERNFNNDSSILQWKEEIKNSIWDKVWDKICAAFGVVTPHSKQLAEQEHRMKVDQIRTANLKKEFTEKTAEKYREAKSMVDAVTAEEKKWEKIFLKEGEEKLPELPEEQKAQLKDRYKSYQYKTPIEICMALAARKISFQENMTPENMKSSYSQQIKEVSEMYHSLAEEKDPLVRTQKLEQMQKELRTDPKEVSFHTLGYEMEEAAKRSGSGPAIETKYTEKEYRDVPIMVEKVDRRVNTEYNPFRDEKVREKAIKIMPLLKHCGYKNINNSLNIGSIMAKEWYGMMENSTKLYEAVQEQRTKDYLPLARGISENQAWWMLIRNLVVLNANGNTSLAQYGYQAKDMNAPVNGSYLTGMQCGSHFDVKGDKYISPLGAAMTLAKGGLEGNIDQLCFLESETADPTRVNGGEQYWQRARLLPKWVNAGVVRATEEADKLYDEMEAQKEVKTELNQSNPDKQEIEQEELDEGGMGI